MNKQTNKTKTMALLVVLLFIALSLGGVLAAPHVAINYDNAAYLDPESNTRKALDVIEAEFDSTGNLNVMIKDIPVDEANEVRETLQNTAGVLNVSFNANDPNSYRDGNALFMILTDGSEYDDSTRALIDTVKESLDPVYGDRVAYGGTAMEKKNLQDLITGEMSYIFLVAVGLTIVILLLTSRSWLEPVLLLAASGAAVLINQGTNLLFGEISYITNSIAAILQMALSIDYSIMLITTYRANQRNGVENPMKAAILSCVRPVSASALTTIAGLLALLFMSFTIGFDIGIVLMKGIFLSALTAVTLFPALIILFDPLLVKTAKPSLVPKGRFFAGIAQKAGRVIIPVALAAVVLCGVLTNDLSYIFTNKTASNSEISDVFGSTNTMIVVYPSSEDTDFKEKQLANRLGTFIKWDGSPAMLSYTAYSNTVMEDYELEKTVNDLHMTQNEAELLYTMYHLYGDPTRLTMDHNTFVNYLSELVNTNDADTVGIMEPQAAAALKELNNLQTMLTHDHTASQMTSLLKQAPFNLDVTTFAVSQLYGMRGWETLSDKTIPFETMLDFLVQISAGTEVSDRFRAQDVENLHILQDGIAELRQNMSNPLIGGFVRSNAHVQSALSAMEKSYAYNEFVPALTAIADDLQTARSELTGMVPAFLRGWIMPGGEPAYIRADVPLTDSDVQQIYIMYFTQKGKIGGSMTGRQFVDALQSAYATNPSVQKEVKASDMARLGDLEAADAFLSSAAQRTYVQMALDLSSLQESVKYGAAIDLTEEMVSGVYLKYSLARGKALSDPISAGRLLDFVISQMDTNALLKARISEEQRALVESSRAEIERANTLFKSTHYTRMLVNVDLPGEGTDTTNFVNFMNKSVRDLFGEDAYAAGELATVVDMQESFVHDRQLINIFTLISIFVIVALIFRSLSLPVILVAIIQGAIWISLSASLVTGSPIFFMSYVIASCILMGSTIDYGILMSGNYVAYRKELDRKEALLKSLEAAMPTVFSSGLILMVCGFVIYAISTETSIFTVGLLLGRGTILSVTMVTLVLPAMLYWLDKPVRGLTLHRREKSPADNGFEDIDSGKTE